MIGLWFLIAMLAAWRITSLIARERGPFAIGAALRLLFGVHHEPDGTPSYDDDGEPRLNSVSRVAAVDTLAHEIARGMTCVWCCGVWVSAAVTLLLARVAALVFDGASFVLVWLAISSGVILIQTTIDRLRG